MRFDTNSKQIEPGTYKVTVAGYPKIINVAGFDKVEFTFSIEGQEKTLTKSFFFNQIASLFKALNFKEVEPGVFDGDISTAYNKVFYADLSFEKYTKKDGTEGLARRLDNFRAFDDEEGISPDEIVWQD